MTRYISMRYFCAIVAVFIFVSGGECQQFHVRLDTLTVLDDPMIDVHILTSAPNKPVRLPPSETENRRFFSEFYSWQMAKDPEFVIMVVSKQDGDLLCIDKNNNNDLTDDGPPVFFPFQQDTLTFDLTAPSDPNQRVKFILSRKLRPAKSNGGSADTTRKNYVDGVGNLNPKFAKFVGMFRGNPDFKGAYGSFYFDDRVTLRRGSVTLDGRRYSLGLFDFGNNGLYNDSDDVIIVDREGNGTLCYLDKTQVHKLNDVFELAGRNFRVRDLDKYGTWIDLQQTTNPVTSLFIQEQDSIHAASASAVTLDSALWGVRAISLDSSLISFKDYAGKYLLLNFWGEWCNPCLEELGSLKRAWEKYDHSRIQFLSFVKIRSISNVRMVIRDSSITWPQLCLTAELEQKFRIYSYPRNILVFPDGVNALITDSVNDQFFQKNVH